ncbi:hypothetical protein ISF_04496 [Cordyceps fumosorosea ARSEF 2679]|uniref:Uncharacterized protein n=1 Tax=Cordyceps fumosorosea (strain ARSEF 2679) TaxID=1081104 RepID=A0A167WHA2_CORFA|nr:hypothetical protein ISF_04496 [Cordyceps fumosorosea ARSEF 2679]OAA63787.1 hypothetical protein ISF_04496 [Cordyceps fumosorosea ARSEF 2679]
MAVESTSLETTDTRVMLMLGHVLWVWPLCSQCTAGRACTDDECKTRVIGTKRYFQFYKELIGTYLDDSFVATRAFQTHEDLFTALQSLIANPRMTRKQLADTISRDRHLAPNALNAAVSLVVKVLAMIDPSSSRLFSSPGTLELGRYRAPWRDHVPFCDYVQDMFPAGSGGEVDGGNSDRFEDMKDALRASELKKKLRLTLRLTHDLRDHLQFDRKHRILDIFHLTSFLKEQLRLSKGAPSASSSDGQDSPDDDSNGPDHVLLPRQLLLETLSSVQQILFPPSDARCRQLLRTLVDSAGFDPDAARYELASVRRRGERARYVYLAERLEDLFEEARHPRPDGWLDRALERRSGKRHVMCATVVGLVVALVLGVGSLAAGVFQAVVAYLAWKNP